MALLPNVGVLATDYDTLTPLQPHIYVSKSSSIKLPNPGVDATSNNASIFAPITVVEDNVKKILAKINVLISQK